MLKEREAPLGSAGVKSARTSIYLQQVGEYNDSPKNGKYSLEQVLLEPSSLDLQLLGKAIQSEFYDARHPERMRYSPRLKVLIALEQILRSLLERETQREQLLLEILAKLNGEAVQIGRKH